MLAFTGRGRRYLWTDAYAVCNWLGLGERERALRLVDEVHQTLGRHGGRWLDGASEAHPTRGGLRIGKPLPERAPGERIDERREWDRDGQYFHYLTRWMHALHQVSRATSEERFEQWARELAEAAERAFVKDGRMVWKMSVDLSRPLVASMGQHDPLDGYVSCLEIGAPAAAYQRMLAGVELVTSDPLGIGGLLDDALRMERLKLDPSGVLAAARDGLQHVSLRDPPWQRLAFRELGLAIGLHAAERLAIPGEIARFIPLAEEIEAFWLRHAGDSGWSDHQDINDVMLATSFAPAGWLD